MTEKTCLIVEDHLETAEYLAQIAKLAFPDLETLIVHDLKTALNFIRSHQVSAKSLRLAIIDLGLPDGSGVDLIREIKQKYPDVPSIVATIYDDDGFLFKALAAGAFGYLLKADDKEFMVSAIKQIENENPPLSPSIARRILQHFREDHLSDISNVKLSPREHETLILIARGLTVGEVAAQLKLSAQTVAGYVKIIYQKLHVSNRVELIREATRCGLI